MTQNFENPHLYEPATEHEHQHDSAEVAQVVNRGSVQYAATLLRGIIANDERPTTALDLAAATADGAPPACVSRASERRAVAALAPVSTYSTWLAEAHETRASNDRSIADYEQSMEL
jgi:hypothetical protein